MTLIVPLILVLLSVHTRFAEELKKIWCCHWTNGPLFTSSSFFPCVKSYLHPLPADDGYKLLRLQKMDENGTPVTYHKPSWSMKWSWVRQMRQMRLRNPGIWNLQSVISAMWPRTRRSHVEQAAKCLDLGGTAQKLLSKSNLQKLNGSSCSTPVLFCRLLSTEFELHWHSDCSWPGFDRESQETIQSQVQGLLLSFWVGKKKSIAQLRLQGVFHTFGTLSGLLISLGSFWAEPIEPICLTFEGKTQLRFWISYLQILSAVKYSCSAFRNDLWGIGLQCFWN